MGSQKTRRNAPTFNRAFAAIWQRHRRCQQEWSSKAPAIVAQYGLQGHEIHLTEAMTLALERYDALQLENRHRAAGLGSIEQLNQLESALRRCTSLLANEGLVNRLELAAIKMPSKGKPTVPAAEVHYKFGACVFDTVAHTRAEVAGLLSVVKYGRNIDGRAYNKLPRDDLLAAAEPLHNFWVNVAGRRGGRWHRGSYSPAVRFIHSCLQCLDDTVKLSLVAKRPSQP